jgi:threonine dehydrogenase-like Zn-dependent dehydrogenase
MQSLRQKILMIDGPGVVRFHERSVVELGPRDILVRPSWSSFKHGTEMMAYSGRSPFATRRFNAGLRLFEDRPEGEAFYPRAMGSMAVGVVEEAGSEVRNLSPGQEVYGWAPVADRHVLPADGVALLGGLAPEAALSIDPASFALGGVIDGAIAPFDTVLITGLGAIGLYAVQYCRAIGARVIAASSFARRRELAAAYGAQHVYDSAAHEDLARLIKEQHGGVDAAIECSGNLATLNLAIRAARQCGRVICVGFYGPGRDSLKLGEEFFHNRISLLASLPALSWANPTRSDPPLYAKDLQARVERDFLERKIIPDGMFDPVMPFSAAEQAADLIATSPDRVVKILLKHL